MKFKLSTCLLSALCLFHFSACTDFETEVKQQPFSAQTELESAILEVPESAFYRVASNATYGCRRPHGYGLYDVSSGQTFVCWNGAGMSIFGSAYDHAEGTWSEPQTIQELDYYGKWDYHNYPNMSQTADGRLIVSWADHCDTLHIARAEMPHSLMGTWETQKVAENRNAYPMLFTVDDVTYIFYSVDEERAWPYRSFGYIKSEDNADSWSEHFRAIDTEKKDPNHIDEIYAFHYAIEAATDAHPSRVQFTWLMRGGPNGHNRGGEGGYFAYFLPKTGSWQSADGVSLGDWIDYEEMRAHCTVVATEPYLQGYPIDKIMSASLLDGRPMVLYNFEGHAHQAIWNGQTWDHMLISDGNVKSIRQMGDGRIRILLATPGQSLMEIRELAAEGGEWASVFESAIPYDSGATNSWSMGFIEGAQPELEVLISQIERGQEKVDYSGSWPVWAVNTQVDRTKELKLGTTTAVK